MKGSITGSLLITVIVFLFLFPTLLMFSELWSYMRPVINNNVTGSQHATNVIRGIGDSFFYFSADSILVILYFALVIALMISALYEAAHPETLPLGLLFLIPLILVTFPLSDIAHAFYTNPGFANVAPYYASTEYLSDNSPALTILFTLAYLVLVITKKQIFQAGAPAGPGIVSG
jgi:hypothetical protein